MPDEINEQTPETPITPPVVAPEPPNETADQKYNRLYGKPAETPAIPSEVTSTLQEIQSALAKLNTPQVPATPPPSSGVDWVENIRKGDYAAAQAALAAHVQAALLPELKRVKQEAYTEALQASDVNSEMKSYLASVRSANPDIASFERYLQGPVQERIQLAQAAGRITTPTAFLREYRAAVDDEVVKFRNLSLQLRAAGKDEATTRTSDVQRSTPLTPQQVQSAQNPQGATPNMNGESESDYFARRRQDEARRKGM